jgi:ATP-dependent DNA ligase
MSILQPLLLFGVGWVVARGLKTRRCRLGCEGIVSKRLGSIYRRGRSPHWIKVKNPNAPAVKREAEEDWGN